MACRYAQNSRSHCPLCTDRLCVASTCDVFAVSRERGGRGFWGNPRRGRWGPGEEGLLHNLLR